MSSKYQYLARFLKLSDQDMIRMSFKEIEEKINGPLPPAASNHRAWWSNSQTHSHARHGWLRAGYETSNVDMEGQELIFFRMANQKTELRNTQFNLTSVHSSTRPTGRKMEKKIENIINSAGGAENFEKITSAIQQYIDGDLLETELGRILRKLWPRN